MSLNSILKVSFITVTSFVAYSLAHGQVGLTGTTYSENFNSLGSGLPSGWSLYTGANNSSLGTVVATSIASSTWGDTGGAFKNFASSTGLASDATTTAQNNATNRALGIRQTGSFGDPGAAFAFNFDSTGFSISSLSIELHMLSVQPRSTTWTLQYGLGASPTVWNTITTYSDPGAFGATPVVIDNSVVTAAISDQSSVFFRVVALGASTSTGSRDSFAIDNFSMSFSSVPEPSTYTAIAGALVLAGVMVRRRRRA